MSSTDNTDDTTQAVDPKLKSAQTYLGVSIAIFAVLVGLLLASYAGLFGTGSRKIQNAFVGTNMYIPNAIRARPREDTAWEATKAAPGRLVGATAGVADTVFTGSRVQRYGSNIAQGLGSAVKRVWYD